MKNYFMFFAKNTTVFFIIFFALLLATKVTASQLPNFSNLVKNNRSAVVNISAIKEANSRKPKNIRHDDEPDVNKYFFGESLQLPSENKASLGSGFIISKDGYILTSYHVVQDAEKVLVSLQDRRELEAKVIGSDSKSDLALLQVNANNLPAVKIGKSAKLEVGEWVLAIGSPFGFEASATKGIISFLGRSLTAGDSVPYIQTDVPINSGNSGGPLFNLKGEVVGINSQIYSDTGGFVGLSFAIPIDTAVKIVEQLKQYGEVRRTWLGVSIRELELLELDSLGLTNRSGAYVAHLVKDGPADKGGLKVGDVILRFDTKEIISSTNLPMFVAEAEIGKQVEIDVWRKNSVVKLQLKVGLLAN